MRVNLVKYENMKPIANCYFNGDAWYAEYFF